MILAIVGLVVYTSIDASLRESVEQQLESALDGPLPAEFTPGGPVAVVSLMTAAAIGAHAAAGSPAYWAIAITLAFLSGAILLLNDFDVSSAFDILVEGCLEAGIKIDVIGKHRGSGGFKFDLVVRRLVRRGLAFRFRRAKAPKSAVVAQLAGCPHSEKHVRCAPSPPDPYKVSARNCLVQCLDAIARRACA